MAKKKWQSVVLTDVFKVDKFLNAISPELAHEAKVYSFNGAVYVSVHTDLSIEDLYLILAKAKK